MYVCVQVFPFVQIDMQLHTHQALPCNNIFQDAFTRNASLCVHEHEHASRCVCKHEYSNRGIDSHEGLYLQQQLETQLHWHAQAHCLSGISGQGGSGS